MTFEDFEQEFWGTHLPAQNKDIRQGQAYMNLLREKRPDLYDTVTNHFDKRTIDPYYNDSNIENCSRWLEKNW